LLLRALPLVLALGACKPRPSDATPQSSSSGRPASAVEGKVAEIDLTGSVPESMDSGGLFPLPATRTYTGLVRSLERALDDPETTGYFVRLGDESGLDWAHVEELGRFFARFRKQGKSVICHAHTYSNKTMGLAARACDRIWLSPGGSVDSVGIAAQLVFLKSALDKLNIQFDLLHMGKYKSAGEPLTRDAPSDEAREAVTEMITSIRRTWLEGAGAGSKRPDIRADLEHGPWTAEDAKARGLVDALGFESDAREDAKKRANAESTATAFGQGGESSPGLNVAEIIRIIAGSGERGSGRAHVAVLVLAGSISMEAEGSLFQGGGITHKAMSKLLKKLREDDSVKAVVLRIDSPGGSALASDLLWHEIDALRAKKPVITSVGSMAASGGYYLACGTSRILAERTSIIGSIGVVGGKLVLDRALAELGVNAVTLPASSERGAAARAAYLSPLAPWDAPTRDKVRRQMESIYELFLRRCAKGRKLSLPKLRESAEGRVWTGEQGKARGLIDEFGGLSRALQLARSMAGLKDNVPVVVEGARESLLEVLMLGDDANAQEISAAALRWQAQKSSALRLPRLIAPFMAGLEPLSRGETVVAALPFALIVD
jgi:protease-4